MYGITSDPDLQVLGFTILIDLTDVGVFNMDSRIFEDIFKASSNKLPMRYG